MVDIRTCYNNNSSNKLEPGLIPVQHRPCQQPQQTETMQAWPGYVSSEYANMNHWLILNEPSAQRSPKTLCTTMAPSTATTCSYDFRIDAPGPYSIDPKRPESRRPRRARRRGPVSCRWWSPKAWGQRRRRWTSYAVQQCIVNQSYKFTSKSIETSNDLQSSCRYVRPLAPGPLASATCAPSPLASARRCRGAADLHLVDWRRRR